MVSNAIGAHRETPPSVVAAAPTRALVGWVMFEWATQPFYTLIVTFLFGPYFVNVVVGDKAYGQSLWGYAAAAAGVLIAVGSPLLGAVADVKGRRKPWLAAFVLILSVSMASLWFATPALKGQNLWLMLLAFVIASAVAEFAAHFSMRDRPAL